MAIAELLLEREARADDADIASTPGGNLGKAYDAIAAHEAAVEARRTADSEPEAE